MCAIMEPPERMKFNQGTLYLLWICAGHASFAGQQNTSTRTGGAGRTSWTRRPDSDFMIRCLL